MVALAGFNTTSVNDTVPTESINPLIIPAANYALIFEQIAWITGAKGSTHKWPILDAVAVTGTATESDEVSATSFTTSVKSATAAIVAVRAFASDLLASLGSTMTPDTQVAAMVDAMRVRQDKDVIAAIGGATNASDNSGSNLSLSNWETALAAFSAQKHGKSRIAFVGSSNQIRDLVAAIRSSGNGGLLAGSGNDVFNGMTRQGFKGMWNGVEIYEGNTTEADADNDAGGFVACSPAGLWMGPEDIAQGGQYQPGSGVGVAVWEKLKVEAGRKPERIGSDMVASSAYACSVTANHLVRAFISKKAAA